MKLFSKKNNMKNNIKEKVLDETEIILRPRICCIDLEEDIIESLKKEKFNINKGTLGKKIRVPNKKRYDQHEVRATHKFPKNLHEYDIIIIDLSYSEIVDYKLEDHIPKNISGRGYFTFISKYPETIFDPRPFSCHLLNKEIKKISNRPILLIVFSTSNYSLEYEWTIIVSSNDERTFHEIIDIYSFFDDVPLSEIKEGKEVTVVTRQNDLKILLEKHKCNIDYNQTFKLPTVWEDSKRIINPNYSPLIKNINNDVVSYVEFRNNTFVFVFPQILDKQNFLSDFLTNILPDSLPEIFPFSTKFIWKQHEEYWLPNHQILVKEKECIEKEFKENIEAKELEIENNKEKYSFLHDLLTETNDNLVLAAQKYFKWLGYQNVRIMDDEENESVIKEEDIQIDLEDGLLVVEVKGIGGTSTDSDCGQIAKIKHRRCKERKSFDVYAMYLVNHQRYIPPLNRKNPPFTDHQIKDAENDERGLLTTWQLFNLYFDIEKGLITKEEARNRLLQYGLIEFRPENLVFIDEPKEILKDKKVCIVNLKDVKIKINDELIVEKNGRFDKVIIQEIMLDDKPVIEIDNEEVGIKLDKKIMKKSKLWKRINS